MATRLIIYGRVQGVWYRGWAVSEASALGLRGWVRNRADGTVEALLIGEHHREAAMVERAREGPPGAAVTGIDIVHADDDGSTDFHQRASA
ncbi:MAG: acylphosphatase [Alphaproteobacteria bacterium]|nr:acylphosphatase [Alphaproteobacteria bacterium]